MFQGSSFSQSSTEEARCAFSKRTVRYDRGTNPFFLAVSMRENIPQKLSVL